MSTEACDRSSDRPRGDRSLFDGQHVFAGLSLGRLRTSFTKKLPIESHVAQRSLHDSLVQYVCHTNVHHAWRIDNEIPVSPLGIQNVVLSDNGFQNERAWLVRTSDALEQFQCQRHFFPELPKIDWTTLFQFARCDKLPWLDAFATASNFTSSQPRETDTGQMQCCALNYKRENTIENVEEQWREHSALPWAFPQSFQISEKRSEPILTWENVPCTKCAINAHMRPKDPHKLHQRCLEDVHDQRASHHVCTPSENVGNGAIAVQSAILEWTMCSNT